MVIAGAEGHVKLLTRVVGDAGQPAASEILLALFCAAVISAGVMVEPAAAVLVVVVAGVEVLR